MVYKGIMFASIVISTYPPYKLPIMQSAKNPIAWNQLCKYKMNNEIKKLQEIASVVIRLFGVYIIICRSIIFLFMLCVYIEYKWILLK